MGHLGETHETIRCIYGSTIQRRAEAAGMKGWRDKNCASMHRGHECPHELRKYGIDVIK